MRNPQLVTALACGLALAWAQAAPPVPREPDWRTVTGTYPQTGTLQAQEEDAILHWLQSTRTRADVARATPESRPDLGLFLEAAGSSADPGSFPATKALLKQAKEDLKVLVHGLKAGFARPRPATTDPTLTPIFPGDGTFSFPSRHATEGILYGTLLAQLDPTDREALLEEGRLIGDDRAMAGVHWPSDVTAGQRLGTAYAAWWLAQPDNAALFQQAAQEWHPSR